jgi:hypothetical protein
MAVVTGWRGIGCSVRGASHERTGLPNQDAIGWDPTEPSRLPLALAISDGHGSPRCFRSDVGARFSVEATLGALRELIDAEVGPSGHSAMKRIAEESLPQMVVRRWSEAVDANLAARPFEPAELERLDEVQDQRGPAAVEARPRLAYGATSVAVLVAETFLLFFQLGDGDILIVAEDGQVTRPLPDDERLFANETTSLSSDDAWRDARVAFQSLSGAPPALILLSSDGYANSFRVEEEFVRVGPDLLALLREQGVEGVAEMLPDWLTAATREGSGDDITLGLVCRLEALAAPAEPLEAAEAASAASEQSAMADQSVAIAAEQPTSDAESRTVTAVEPPPETSAAAETTVEQAMRPEDDPMQATDAEAGQLDVGSDKEQASPLWERIWRGLPGRGSKD